MEKNDDGSALLRVLRVFVVDLLILDEKKGTS
jgi:hypothetical protein